MGPYPLHLRLNKRDRVEGNELRVSNMGETNRGGQFTHSFDFLFSGFTCHR